MKPQGPLLSPQLWKVKKALKMSVVWRGLRPECQVSLCRALWAAPPHPPPPLGPTCSTSRHRAQHVCRSVAAPDAVWKPTQQVAVI